MYEERHHGAECDCVFVRYGTLMDDVWKKRTME